MLHRVLFASCLLAGAGLVLAFLPGTEMPVRAALAGAPACPDRLVGQASLVCGCSAEATASGSVWGSDLYTDDSRVCRAAVHAGVIGPEGGDIWVYERPGQSAYPAVERNGVSSSSWAAWQRSIAFQPASEAPADAKPWAQACPANAVGLAIGTRLACSCSIEALQAGSVWGSGPYTADSAICRAARHAGTVSTSGGEIAVRVTAGRSSYPASERNGVSTSQWASYDTSFEFD